MHSLTITNAICPQQGLSAPYQQPPPTPFTRHIYKCSHATSSLPSIKPLPQPAPLHSPPQARPRKRSSSEARAKLPHSQKHPHHPSPPKNKPLPKQKMGKINQCTNPAHPHLIFAKSKIQQHMTPYAHNTPNPKPLTLHRKNINMSKKSRTFAKSNI